MQKKEVCHLKIQPQNRLFSNHDLTKLIIPLIFEQGLAMSVGIADTMMISSVGEAAVSGVSLVDMINVLIFAVFSAMATGGAVVTAQMLGARKEEEACRTTNQLLYTVVIISLCLMAGALALNRRLLALCFGAIEADVMDNAVIYLMITGLSFPFLAIYNACAALFRSMGRSNITLRVSILMNVINVAGNAVCIYGLKMGAAGVAIPSLLSRAAAAIAIFLRLRNPENTLHFVKERFRLDPRVIRRILYIGVPSGIEGGIFQLGKIVVVSIISAFGTVEIAANSVAQGLWSFSNIPGQAIQLAMITVIGRCVGAGDEEQVRYYSKKLMIVGQALVTSLMIVIMLTLRNILSLYGLQPDTLELAWKQIMLHDMTGVFIWSFSFILPHMLRACNDVRFTMFTSVFSMIVFRLGFSWILGHMLGWGGIGTTIAMLIDWVFRSAAFGWRWLSGGWKKQAFEASVP